MSETLGTDGSMTLEQTAELADAIRSEVGKAIVGMDDIVDHLLIALIAQGHVLLEGPPGTAKTFLAQCFAHATGMDIRPHPVHARPAAGRYPRLQPVQFPDQPVHPDARADLSRAAAGRRDQPHPAQDAGRAA